MQRSWRHFGLQFGLGVAILSLLPAISSASTTATVTGVVRDTQGVAQMGAMVQVLSAESATIATAFTDLNGRYSFAHLTPGSYRIRATAALFIPAIRNNLRLSTGMRATVNLTLSTLVDPVEWLPAKPRAPDEPGDDWTWTLRSAVNRPILRMLGNGEMVLVSPVGEGPGTVRMEARNSVLGGDGGFAKGGIHDLISVDRVNEAAGTEMIVRADIAASGIQGSSRPTEIGVGFERKGAFGSESRIVMNYASHPEMLCEGVSGLQVIRTATAERMKLGDFADVEAGGTVYAIRMAGTTLTSRPFVQVAVHPGEVWAVQYRLATSQDLQDYDGLNSIGTDLPMAAVQHGKLLLENGRHQALSISRKVGNGSITAAVYHDSLDRSAVSGTGPMTGQDMLSGVMLDTSTGNFRVLAPGYGTTGVDATLVEPITSSLWAALEYASGAGLAMEAANTEGLAEVQSSLHPEYASAVTAELRGRMQKTGTRIRTSYRWQPQHLVSAVNPYGEGSDQAYLSFFIRQEVRWGDRLPPGLEATLDVTNLLAQGYHPFLSADGHTLYLAQAARTVRGGLSFRF